MPFTSYREAREEMLTYFTTEWNLQGSPPTILYDDKEKELPESAFVRITLRHNDDEQQTLGGIGQRRYEQFGVIVIQIFDRPGQGLLGLDNFAKIAVDIFKGKSTGSDRVLFTRSRMNEVGVDGAWNQTNVVVDFKYDLIA